MASSGHLARGAAAEQFAARALQREGYRILLRNHRNAAGELDIVALRRGRFAFVEVKGRTVDGGAGPPEEALTARKLRRVSRAGARLLQERGVPDAPREIIGAAVDLAADGTPLAVRFIPVEEVR